MMKKNCRITLKPLKSTKELQSGFSSAGLKALTGDSKFSPVLPFTATSFAQQKPAKQKGMSISGVQPKLQLVMDTEKRIFNIVDNAGEFILKPSPQEYPHLAEIEHCIMSVMQRLKFDVPPFGMLQFSLEDKEGEVQYAYVIKRYDRIGGQKLHQEQLDGAMNVPEKYGKTGPNGSQSVSYETIGQFLIERGVLNTLPSKQDYFRRVVYGYLFGNNDMHLRNFGLLLKQGRYQLAPVYDFISTAPYPGTFASGYLALPLLRIEENDEELAPGFNTKYGEYLGMDFILLAEGIGINGKLAMKMLSDDLKREKATVINTISASFVPSKMQKQIVNCYTTRLDRLQIFKP